MSSKRTLFLIGAVMALLAVVATVFLYDRGRHEARYDARSVSYGIRVAGPESDARAEEASRLIKERMKLLRDKWSVWAQAHKELLQQTLLAKPNEKVAFDNIVATLPNRPSVATNGFGFEDTDVQTKAGEIIKVSWQSPRHGFRTEKLKRDYEETTVPFLRKRFSQKHDYVIVSTSAPGIDTMRLWASGRVTHEQEGRKEVGPGDFKSGIVVDEEVYPPYDFLNSKEQKK